MPFSGLSPIFDNQLSNFCALQGGKGLIIIIKIIYCTMLDQLVLLFSQILCYNYNSNIIHFDHGVPEPHVHVSPPAFGLHFVILPKSARLLPMIPTGSLPTKQTAVGPNVL